MPFITFVAAVAAMFPMGGATVVAIRKGRGDKEGANKAFMTAFSLTVYISFCCSLDKEVITVDRSYSGLRHDIVSQRTFKFRKKDGNLKLRFLVDKFSIELFVNDGEQAFSMCLYDTPQEAGDIRFFADKPVKIAIEKYDIVV